jgi:antitoxin MazE
MQVAKWGNSLAIRIPADVARRLGIKEGDDIEILAADEHQIAISRGRTVEAALARIRSKAVAMPEGWRFDRGELYGDDAAG